nr:zinc-dependent sulfurtransferase SufU-like [Nerophis lumbriciformis]
MNDDLRDLYQQVIIDHYRQPRNFALLEAHNRHADGHNPLCGDKVEIYARVEDGVVREVTFQGAGCAISTASASMMTEAVKGKPIAEAERLFERFREYLTDDASPSLSSHGDEDLERLEALGGVREFPMRVKCATLAWHTLQAALAKADADLVTTE